jgi:hypothetical protein
LVWAAAAFALRIGVKWIIAKVRGHPFTAFDHPAPIGPSFYTGNHHEVEGEEDRAITNQEYASVDGKFF